MSLTAIGSPATARRHRRKARLVEQDAVALLVVLVLLGASDASGIQASQAKPDSAAPHSPLDLRGDRDPNGLFLNPNWSVTLDQMTQPFDVDAEKECRFLVRDIHSSEIPGSRRLTQRSPNCTSVLPSLNEPLVQKYAAVVCNEGKPESGQPEGHLNWGPVTDTGMLLWDTWASDLDYNFFLVTGMHAGETKGNRGTPGIELEANSAEFADRMQIADLLVPVSRGWSRFIKAVKGKQVSTSDSIMSGKFAIATGLFGLDAVHDYHSELHPLWALAVETDPNPSNNVWLMLVRNMGDEGECASGEAPLQLDQRDSLLTYRFQIPWKGSATGVKVLWGDTLSSFFAFGPYVSGPEIAVSSDRGLVVTFHLSKPTQADSAAFVFGELHLVWTGVSDWRPYIGRDSLRAYLGWRDALESGLVTRIETALVPPRSGPVGSFKMFRPARDSEVGVEAGDTAQPLPFQAPQLLWTGKDAERARFQAQVDSVCAAPPPSWGGCRPPPIPTTAPFFGYEGEFRRSTGVSVGVDFPAGHLAESLETRLMGFVDWSDRWRGGGPGRIDSWGIEASFRRCIGACYYTVTTGLGGRAVLTMGPPGHGSLRLALPTIGFEGRFPDTFLRGLAMEGTIGFVWPHAGLAIQSAIVLP